MNAPVDGSVHASMTCSAVMIVVAKPDAAGSATANPVPVSPPPPVVQVMRTTDGDTCVASAIEIRRQLLRGDAQLLGRRVQLLLVGAQATLRCLQLRLRGTQLALCRRQLRLGSAQLGAEIGQGLLLRTEVVASADTCACSEAADARSVAS